MMRELTNKELESIVLKQPSAFLCGNGYYKRCIWEYLCIF